MKFLQVRGQRRAPIKDRRALWPSVSGTLPHIWRRISPRVWAGLLAASLVAGCGAPEVILPGERLGLRGEAVDAGETRNVARAIRLSAPRNLSAWTHRAANPAHDSGHLAFGAAPALLWSAEIGEGNSRKFRISASPVAAAGVIYAMDSHATVTAVSANGQVLWSADLTPPTDRRDDASGGGLAISDGVLVAITGFGEMIALDAGTGAQIWKQKLEAPATGAPTVANGIVYAVTRDSRAWAVNLADGRMRWQLTGTPSVTGVVGGAGPAVDRDRVYFPFGSAQIVAAFAKGGFRLWDSSAAGGRLGEAYAQVTDITGDPVAVGNRVYVGNPSGRSVALDRDTGDRLWTAPEGALGPVVVNGGSLFLVSDQARLVRLDADNGAVIWRVDLPNFVPASREWRQRDVYPHYGPVLAGGRLWVASGDGQLRAFAPVDGVAVGSVALAGGAASAPIIVDGVMYVVNRDGQLLAFR